MKNSKIVHKMITDENYRTPYNAWLFPDMDLGEKQAMVEDRQRMMKTWGVFLLLVVSVSTYVLW